LSETGYGNGNPAPTATRWEIQDMNGDGLPDFIDTSVGGSNYWQVYLNTGSGFSPNYVTWYGAHDAPVTTHSATDPSTGVISPYTDIALQDMNGDGLPDWVDSTNTFTWSVYLNSGSAFAAAPLSWPNPAHRCISETGFGNGNPAPTATR